MGVRARSTRQTVGDATAPLVSAGLSVARRPVSDRSQCTTADAAADLYSLISTCTRGWRCRSCDTRSSRSRWRSTPSPRRRRPKRRSSAWAAVSIDHATMAKARSCTSELYNSERPSSKISDWASDLRGRYWDRTSDLFGVKADAPGWAVLSCGAECLLTSRSVLSGSGSSWVVLRGLLRVCSGQSATHGVWVPSRAQPAACRRQVVTSHQMAMLAAVISGMSTSTAGPANTATTASTMAAVPAPRPVVTARAFARCPVGTPATQD